MMENDDKLISQFMHANKHEIEDNGFSRRVIRQLPEHANGCPMYSLQSVPCFAAYCSMCLTVSISCSVSL